MVDPDPPRPPRLVGELLGNIRLLYELVKALSCRFRTVWEDGGPLLMEIWYVRVLHSFLSRISSGVDLVSGFERLALLGVDQD